MGTWTLYTAGADLSLLNAILNGVAMICTQTAFIWGFALVASLWRLVATATAASMAAGSRSSAAITSGSFGALLPLVLAMLLTFPGFKCTLQVESTLTGGITNVANVPFAIAIIPVAGSLMASNVGALVTTGFSSVNPSYNVISASGNGFLDPMKRLLGAKTAIQRLNGVDSELRTLVSACLAQNSGVDYAALNNRVINAGNSGATPAQTLQVNGVDSTGIGSLLWEASQNPTGIVLGLHTNGQAVLSCFDAANLVRIDIDAALNSREFSRVVQGAVNGMDEPQSTATYDINQFDAEYGAMRKWSGVVGSLAGGQQQANAESINFLFSEIVGNALNCLQASSADKAVCEASMIQANEVERNNVQAAANEVPMLMYSGSFGKYILALIIGLGPVIVMFMMFSGVGAHKGIKTAVHIMVWPLLVTNVGAELVNAMISLQFSNFMASVAQQGFLSLATMNTVYKELSLQVGVGSHVMASLPVLMSMIFALGETAALVSVANEIKPKGTEVGQAEAPSPTAAAPLTRQGSPATITQGQGFSRMQAVGALDAVSATAQFGSVARDTSQAVSSAATRQQTTSSMQSLARDFTAGADRGDYRKFDISNGLGEVIRGQYEENIRNSHRDSAGDTASTNSQNSNTSKAGVSGGAHAGVGSGGISFGLKAGADASTETSATDTKGRQTQGGVDDAAERAKALSAAMTSDQTQNYVRSHGNSAGTSFSQKQSVARNFQTLTSDAKSQTATVGNALKVGSSLVAANNKIGSDEIAQQMGANGAYARFQLSEGRARDQDPSTRPYLEKVQRDMATGATDSIVGNPQANSAVARTRAAALQYADPNATEAERFRALEFITGGSNAMIGGAFAPPPQDAFRKPFDDLTGPVDRTGVDGRRVEALAPRAPGALTAAPGTGRRSATSTGGSTGPSLLPANSQARMALEAARAGAVGPANRVELPQVLGNETVDRARALIDDADSSGLSPNGPGTIRRTAANVVDNARDLVRAPGERSRVRFGRAPATSPSPSPPAAPVPEAGAGAPGSRD